MRRSWVCPIEALNLLRGCAVALHFYIINQPLQLAYQRVSWVTITAAKPDLLDVSLISLVFGRVDSELAICHVCMDMFELISTTIWFSRRGSISVIYDEKLCLTSSTWCDSTKLLPRYSIEDGIRIVKITPLQSFLSRDMQQTLCCLPEPFLFDKIVCLRKWMLRSHLSFDLVWLFIFTKNIIIS